MLLLKPRDCYFVFARQATSANDITTVEPPWRRYFSIANNPEGIKFQCAQHYCDSQFYDTILSRVCWYTLWNTVYCTQLRMILHGFCNFILTQYKFSV